MLIHDSTLGVETIPEYPSQGNVLCAHGFRKFPCARGVRESSELVEGGGGVGWGRFESERSRGRGAELGYKCSHRERVWGLQWLESKGVEG